MSVRLLGDDDASALDAFLARRSETSMFMRSNLRHAGATFAGLPNQARYFGAFDDGVLRGVIALCWNGNVMLETRVAGDLEALLGAARAAAPDFLVKGVLAPDEQARAALARLALRADDVAVSRAEGIYKVVLDDLTPPDQLVRGSWRVRRAESADLGRMTAWRLAFEIEALGAAAGPAEERAAREDVGRWIDERRGFVLEVDGAVAAQAVYNAALPDIVQIGGVYTPPPSRNRGYARGVVAGALITARAQGVQASVLFTQNPSAVRAYESIGYRLVGDYHMTLLREGVALGARA